MFSLVNKYFHKYKKYFRLWPSYYSSRIVFSYIPIEFGTSRNIAPFDPMTPKTLPSPCPEKRPIFFSAFKPDQLAQDPYSSRFSSTFIKLLEQSPLKTLFINNDKYSVPLTRFYRHLCYMTYTPCCCSWYQVKSSQVAFNKWQWQSHKSYNIKTCSKWSNKM